MRKIRSVLISALIAACAVFAFAACGGGVVDDGTNGGGNGSGSDPGIETPADNSSVGLSYVEIKVEGKTVGYEVSRGSNSAVNVVIPNELNGVPVIKIASRGFENSKRMKKITIPANVVEIAANAFKDCDVLENAVFAATDGWTVTYGMTVDENGEQKEEIDEVPSGFLSDSQAAAIHLKGNSAYVWKRVAGE